MILAGNVALESMGFKTFGFRRRPRRCLEPEELYWGPEGSGWATSATAASVSLRRPLGRCADGLIYVNPEGPNGNPDPVAAARTSAETFFRMANE